MATQIVFIAVQFLGTKITVMIVIFATIVLATVSNSGDGERKDQIDHPMQPRFTGSRTRPAVRKRLNTDDSPFIGPSPSTKRGADKVDGAVEPRAKRKRIDSHMSTSNASGSFSGRVSKAGGDGEPINITVDFHSFSADALHRYLIQADVAPHLYPSPSSTQNPPLPNSLLNVQNLVPRAPSPLASTTPANRPRRDPKDAHHRRRSSRLLEEEERSRRAPILADAHAVHAVLATLAERHFEKQSVREVDALQQFMLKTRCY